MIKPELLAPAGDLEKLEMAYAYGADAAYIGGRAHSLRARASAFDIDAMKNAARLARQYGKKLYVTLNTVPHPDDYAGLDDYLQMLESLAIDAVICTSLGIIERVKKHTSLSIHLSTQQSVTNADAVEFWRARGVERIILAREVTLDELAMLRRRTDAPLEVFIHGGMCVSYSGRCALSVNMTGRDANRGGCAHSCRWRYTVGDDGALFALGAKELNASPFIKRLMEMNIDSLKIEGRMKSVHYVASVVKSYRMLIDAHAQNKTPDMQTIAHHLDVATNRASSSGFYQGMPTRASLLDGRATPFDPHFVGVVLAYDEKTQAAVIEQRNYFETGDALEIFRHHGESIHFEARPMTTTDGQSVSIARHPKERLKMVVPEPVSPLDIIRKHLRR